MVDFWVYDVGFLILFSLWVVWFLCNRREKLDRQGWIYLYRTLWGIKAINYVGDNFKRLLSSLKYIIIGVGTLLMAGIIWMFGQTISIYIFHPEITKIIKAPPIAPLIPYFPKLFGMESFFPPFYFTYFILALAIVAIVHEFSHGIFMRLFKVKIKSTGFIFLGPILGAFVEEEKKEFEKKKNIEQMTILGAGVFANIIFAIIFYLLYISFFFISFTASGYIFDNYALEAISFKEINSIEKKGNLTEVFVGNQSYYLDKALSIQLERENLKSLVVYSKAPAVLSGLKGAIIRVNDIKIKNHDDLLRFLKKTNPGDTIRIITETNEGLEEYILDLGKHPNKNISYGYLGVGHSKPSPKSILQKSLLIFMKFKESSTYYKTIWDGEFVYFIYHLLWWIMIINLLVALFNMLPLGILDGGRFFYLGILSITGSKKFAKSSFKIMTYFIFLMFSFLMLIWFFRII